MFCWISCKIVVKFGALKQETSNIYSS